MESDKNIMEELYKLYIEGKLQMNPQQQEFMGMNPQQQQFIGMNPQQQFNGNPQQQQFMAMNPQQQFMGMNPQQQQFMAMNLQQQQFMGMGHYFPFGFGNNEQDENINVTFENEENLQRINIIIPKSKTISEAINYYRIKAKDASPLLFSYNNFPLSGFLTLNYLRDLTPTIKVQKAYIYQNYKSYLDAYKEGKIQKFTLFPSVTDNIIIMDSSDYPGKDLTQEQIIMKLLKDEEKENVENWNLYFNIGKNIKINIPSNKTVLEAFCLFRIEANEERALSFKYNDKPLNYFLTLSKSGLENNSVINVEYSYKNYLPKIAEKMLGNIEILKGFPDYPGMPLNLSRLFTSTQIPKTMDVFISVIFKRADDNNRINIQIENNKTVSDLFNRYRLKTMEMDPLKFTLQGKPLNASLTLTEAGIHNESVITVDRVEKLNPDLYNLKFEMKGNYNIITIQISPDKLVSEAISLYKTKLGEKEEDMMFIFNSKKLDKNLTIKGAGLRNGSKILVITKGDIEG